MHEMWCILLKLRSKNIRSHKLVAMDTITVGDCTNLSLGNKSVHLFVVSPPYNVGINYGNGFNDNKEWRDYVEFLIKMMEEMHRTLVDGGRVAINVAGINRKPYKDVPGIVSSILEELGFLLRGTVIWIKGESSARTDCAWGSYMSNTNPVLRDSWESIVMASKETYELDCRTLGLPDITKDEFQQWSVSAWNMRPETRCSWHGAPFPEELPYRCIKWLVPREAIVVDPCCGTGTTPYVAKMLYRHYLAYDQNPEYVRRANERLGNTIFEATTW